jgi:hypothetical protein
MTKLHDNRNRKTKYQQTKTNMRGQERLCVVSVTRLRRFIPANNNCCNSNYQKLLHQQTSQPTQRRSTAQFILFSNFRISQILDFLEFSGFSNFSYFFESTKSIIACVQRTTTAQQVTHRGISCRYSSSSMVEGPGLCASTSPMCKLRC